MIKIHSPSRSPRYCGGPTEDKGQENHPAEPSHLRFSCSGQLSPPNLIRPMLGLLLIAANFERMLVAVNALARISWASTGHQLIYGYT